MVSPLSFIDRREYLRPNFPLALLVSKNPHKPGEGPTQRVLAVRSRQLREQVRLAGDRALQGEGERGTREAVQGTNQAPGDRDHRTEIAQRTLLVT